MTNRPAGANRRGTRGAGTVGGRAPSPPSPGGRHYVRAQNVDNPPVDGFWIKWAPTQATSTITTDATPPARFIAHDDFGRALRAQVQWAHHTEAFGFYDAFGTAGQADTSQAMGQDYTLPSVTSDATTTTTPATLDGYTWRVRARTGDGTKWSRWLAPITYSIYLVQVSGAFYVDENVGANFNQPRQLSAAYVDENVGIMQVIPTADAAYIDENVGVNNPYPIRTTAAYVDENISPNFASRSAATAYLDLNIDPAKHPTPRIWWIVPVRGQEGWLFHIFGHGFGNSTAEFGGQVMLNDLPGGLLLWERIASGLQLNELYLNLRPGTTAGSILKVLLSTPTSITALTNDVIVWEEYWDQPPGTNLGFGISFTIGATEYGSNTDTTRTDDTGAKLQPGTDRSPAYGTWLRHTYTIKPADNGKALGALYFYLVTQYTGQATAAVRIRNVGLLDGASQVAKYWAVPPTIASFTAPAPTTAQNGTAVLSTPISAPNVLITEGLGLDSQSIIPEHGHIVVSVPDGAESGPVIVRLTT